MQCPARLSVTPQGARFLKRPQICLPEALISTGLFLIFCTAVEREFRNCTFQNKSDTIFLSTLVDMLGFARPCISSRQQQAGQPGHNLGQNLNSKRVSTRHSGPTTVVLNLVLFRIRSFVFSTTCCIRSTF